MLLAETLKLGQRHFERGRRHIGDHVGRATVFQQRHLAEHHSGGDGGGSRHAAKWRSARHHRRDGVRRDGAAGHHRSADVIADVDPRSKCRWPSFSVSASRHPRAGERIMRNLAQLLADRLVIANTKMSLLSRELESGPAGAPAPRANPGLRSQVPLARRDSLCCTIVRRPDHWYSLAYASCSSDHWLCFTLLGCASNPDASG